MLEVACLQAAQPRLSQACAGTRSALPTRVRVLCDLKLHFCGRRFPPVGRRVHRLEGATAMDGSNQVLEAERAGAWIAACSSGGELRAAA